MLVNKCVCMHISRNYEHRNISLYMLHQHTYWLTLCKIKNVVFAIKDGDWYEIKNVVFAIKNGDWYEIKKCCICHKKRF